MAEQGMSKDGAHALAAEVTQATRHVVEVLPEDDYFVVDVRRAVPGDSWTLRDEEDWRWLGPRIREAE
jgi:hypothetical protein